MQDDLKKNTLDDEALDNVAGGFKGDYSQIYGLMKVYGDVQGDVNNFEEINSPEERKKVQDILSKAFGGSVELGQYGDKENVYWYNGKVVKQDQVMAGLKRYYSQVRG